MFKLVSLTALIALTSASDASTVETKAEKDENQVKKQFEKQNARISKMSSSPSSKIWKHLKNASGKEYWSFQGASEAQSDFAFAATYKKNSDDAHCMDCHMSGNTWDSTHSKCAAAKQTTTKLQTAYDEKAPAIDYLMTYAEYISMAQDCFSTPAAHCSSNYDLADFKKSPPTNKAGANANYAWKYEYAKGSPAIAAWSVCQYTAEMPYVEKKGKKDYGFKGGLMLHQVVPKTSSVMPIVQIDSVATVLYNRESLSVLSVGNTNKIVIPFADSIEVVWTNTESVPAADVEGFSLTFTRETNSDLAVFTLEHGGVIVWVIIGIVVFCLLCVGIIVWKKCFHKEGDAFYVDDAYARV